MKIKSLLPSSYNWPIYAGIVGVLAILALYTVSLGNLAPSGTVFETAEYLGITSGASLVNDIVYAPHAFVGYLLFKANIDFTLTLRLVSVATALASILCFSLLVKQWFSWRVSALTTAMFATSSWMLFTARWAEPEVMTVMVLPVMLLAASLLKEKEHDRLLPLVTFFAVVCLYVPGVWMVVLGGVLLLLKNIKLAWKRFTNFQRSIWVASGLLPALPLIYGLSKPENAKSLLGLQPTIDTTTVMNNLVWLPNQLIGTGLADVSRWLPGTPVIDVATLGLALMGIIFMIRDNRYPVRRIALLVLSLISIALIALQGVGYIGLLLPLIYMFVAGGITFLLDQWFHVFPKNPLARSFGLVLITVLVFFICVYQAARYHYVWPRSYEAAAVFKK